MLEKLLNALLMGYTPEGNRPEHPGFTLIGTQNPITMAGRYATSTASARRLLSIPLSDYPKKELITLLNARGLSEDEAACLTQSYFEAKQHAMQQHLSPAPTLRELLRLVKTIQQHRAPQVRHPVRDGSSTDHHNTFFDRPDTTKRNRYPEENDHETRSPHSKVRRQ